MANYGLEDNKRALSVISSALLTWAYGVVSLGGGLARGASPLHCPHRILYNLQVALRHVPFQGTMVWPIFKARIWYGVGPRPCPSIHVYLPVIISHWPLY